MMSVPSLDKDPELPTTEMWRGVMKKARKQQGVTQVALAAKIGCSQAIIAGIESGAIKASSLVYQICEALSIPPPHVLVKDETDERWIEIGRILRERMPELYKGQLAGLETMVSALADDKDD